MTADPSSPLPEDGRAKTLTLPGDTPGAHGHYECSHRHVCWCNKPERGPWCPECEYWRAKHDRPVHP